MTVRMTVGEPYLSATIWPRNAKKKTATPKLHPLVAILNKAKPSVHFLYYNQWTTWNHSDFVHESVRLVEKLVCFVCPSRPTSLEFFTPFFYVFPLGEDIMSWPISLPNLEFIFFRFLVREAFTCVKALNFGP